MSGQHNLQRQHRKLEKLAGKLLAASYKPFGSAGDMQRALARFSGTLRMHASMEEDGLYPALLSHDDADVRHKAEQLEAELGPLYARWDEFMERWGSVEAIDGDRMRFRMDLARTLRTLGKRMQKEDRELYPMVQRVLEA